MSIPVFILAGGLGTRLSEETHLKPKPMVEIGDLPILVHIMRTYFHYGFDDFVICAGYKSWEIKQFFLNYEFRMNHIGIDHRNSFNNPPQSLGTVTAQEKWRVRIVDTGQAANTGTRIARAFDFIKDTDRAPDQFAVTYGDGLTDVDLRKEFAFHESHGKIGTLLGVKPVARFGEIEVSEGGRVDEFHEKAQSRQSLINGGYFFFKKEFRKYLTTEDSCILERKPLTDLANDKQLMMYEHQGFWQPMDTLRDKINLQELWDTNRAPWLKTLNQSK